MSNNDVIIYTDGSSRGNPGPGGYGAVLKFGQHRKELSEGFRLTTNNRMELLAAINALNALEMPSTITVVTDSVYVKDGITKWIFGWKSRGWKTAAKQPVKNVELWKDLDAATQRHSVTWEWIKGHAGHEENEKAVNMVFARSSKIFSKSSPVLNNT